MSADNVKVDGEAVNGEDFNLQSALSGDTPDAADGGLDALSGALGGDETSIDSADLGGGGDNPLDGIFSEASDNATQQDGPPAAAGAGRSLLGGLAGAGRRGAAAAAQAGLMTSTMGL